MPVLGQVSLETLVILVLLNGPYWVIVKDEPVQSRKTRANGCALPWFSFNAKSAFEKFDALTHSQQS